MAPKRPVIYGMGHYLLEETVMFWNDGALFPSFDDWI
jgi:hypothetical protein